MDNSYLISEAIGHRDLVLLLVLGGSLITPALYRSLASIRELMFSRHCFRNGLEKRITSSQLHKMLKNTDVELQYYLFSQSPAAIEQQLRNCKSCESIDQCNGYLESGETGCITDLPFCRNKEPICKVKQKQERLYVLRSTTL